MAQNKPLMGRRVALPESRALDLFAEMLEKRGATVWRCPLVAIHDAPDAAAVESWLNDLAKERMDFVVLYTGEGVRRLMGFAERAGLREAVIAGLKGACKVVRGPKPVKALREIGLRADLRAAGPTTEGVIETLTDQSLEGKVVGVQLYGVERNERLMAFLRERGAEPCGVWPYVYASEAEDAQVVELIEAMAAGSVDLIAFTGTPQVRRLWAVAQAHDRAVMLREGLAKVKVAAVGPVVAGALAEQGVTAEVMPAERRYALRPLTEAIIAALG